MSISNEIKKTLILLESLQTSMLSESQIDQLLKEFEVDEANKWTKSRSAKNDPEVKQARLSKHSTLAPILNRQPGGRSLLRWLHREMNLGSQADWGVGRAQRVSQEKGASRPMVGNWGSGIWGNTISSARVLWEIVKGHPDNFIVFVGEHGVGGVRPEKGYIERKTAEYQQLGKEYNPSKDGELPYHYAFYDQDGNLQKVDPNAFGGAGLNPDSGKVSRRGGLPFGIDPNPNLLAVVKDTIGRIKAAYTAYPAAAGEVGHSVEREKISQRAAQNERLSIEQQELKTFGTVIPIIKRIVSQILANAPEQSALKLAIQQKKLAPLLKQKFIAALRSQAKASGIEIQDAAAYREFLEKAEHSSDELKKTLQLYQQTLLAA